MDDLGTGAYVAIECPEEHSTMGWLLDHRVRTSPDDVFLIDGNTGWTYSQVQEHALRFAAGLQSIGVQQGDVVAVMAENRPEATCAWFATGYAGAIENPVNVSLRGDLLVHVLNDGAASVIVLDRASWPSVLEVADRLNHLSKVIVLPDRDGTDGRDIVHPSFEVLAWDALVSRTADRSSLPEVAFHETAQLVYTSGTTGAAKGVLIPHRQQVYIALLVANAMRYVPSDVTLNHLPFFHVANRFVTGSALLVGAKVVLKDRFSLSEFWDWVHEHSITVLTAVGGVSEMLFSRPPHDREKSSLRAVYSVPMPRDAPAFQERFGVTVQAAYGQSETSLVLAGTFGELPPVGSMGRPLPDFEVRVFDEHDREVPPGTVGELVIRPRIPFVTTSGYHNRPDATAETMRNLWWHTGDLVRCDEDGYFYFVDRARDFLRSRGENVSSFEVEQAAMSHPAILEAAAVGLPADMGDHDVLITVVLAEEGALTHREVFDHCAELLPYYAVPRYVEIRPSLPRTPTEKVRKVELREEAQSRLGAAIWDRSRHGIEVRRGGVRVVSGGTADPAGESEDMQETL